MTTCGRSSGDVCIRESVKTLGEKGPEVVIGVVEVTVLEDEIMTDGVGVPRLKKEPPNPPSPPFPLSSNQ